MSTPTARVRIEPQFNQFAKEVVSEEAVLEMMLAERAIERAQRLGTGLLVITVVVVMRSGHGRPTFEVIRKFYVVTDLVPAYEAVHAPASAVAAALGIDA